MQANLTVTRYLGYRYQLLNSASPG